MNKLEKKLTLLKKKIEEYNALARKYGWVEQTLEIVDVDHSKTLKFDVWNDHFYYVKGGYASCRKNVFVKIFQHLFIMRPKYNKLHQMANGLSTLEYNMNHDNAVNKHNEEEMNA